ncbi:MAG: hypothetical protein AB7I68_02260 [Porticoccaceae bacterium]
MHACDEGLMLTPHHRPRQFTDLATNPVFSTRDFRAVPKRFRILVPEYAKDSVPLDQFL